MKRRLHINDFFIQAIAASLRQAGKTADAEVFAQIDGNKWTWGYVSGSNYGSSGNPLKAYGGNIQAYNVVMTRALYYKNGIKTNFSPSVLNTIAMVPKEIRPPYLKDLTTAESNGIITPELLGIDLTKVGCSYYSIGGTSGAKFVVVVGSDETVTDHNTVTKYLPFDMSSAAGFNGGLQKSDPAVKGYDAYGSSSITNNRVAPVEVIVYQGTVPAPAPKEINPNLPNWYMRDFVPVPQKGYETIPALNLTLDWTVLTAKYTAKVHINTILFDLIVDALTTAGNTALADKLKAVNPETFVPWQVNFDSTNKKTILVGAYDSTTKLFFESITFNNYLNKNFTTAIDLGYIYAESAGITWTQLATSAEMKSSALNTLLAETQYSYYGIHVPKNTEFTMELLDSVLPYSIKGLDLGVANRTLTTDYQQSINYAQVNPSWMGGNGYKIYFYPDRT